MLGYYVVRIMLYCSICSLSYFTIAAGLVWRFKGGIPSFGRLEQVDPARTTTLYSADGKVLKRFWEQRRDPIPYDQLPQAAIDALVATEDQLFWRHWGVSLPDIFRALLRNILKEGSLKGHGASTITQQLARNLFLTQNQTWTRKIQEQLTAVLLERTYTKREIIEMYFNQVLFGNGAWGIQAAGRRFFGKNAKDMALSECALLVGLLRGPYYYSPLTHSERALRRRNVVLGLMYRTGRISRSEFRSAKQRPIVLRGADEDIGEAPYFTEYIRRHLERAHGLEVLYRDGTSVYTSLDSRVQRIAQEELLRQLAEIQRDVDRKRRLSPPDSSFWVGIQTREDTLAATVVQGALVALDPHTGHILALVGGRDFNESKFNRAIQALRQPGSAFKPFIYTAAIDNLYPSTLKLPDTAVSIPMADGSLWQPENYDRKFLGWMTMREGLYRSRNVVTTQLVQKIGPKTVVPYARRMGISTPIRAVLSLGMGTSEVKLIDLVGAFGVFPNRGIRVEPVAVLKIVDKDGNVLEEQTQGKEQVALSVETAAVMTNMLQSVMDEPQGTGHGARRYPYRFLRPAAGKTGTTQNFADAWFVGFTPQIVAGVWIGFDSKKISLGKRMSGAVVALPVWAKFMKRVHKALDLPEEEFGLPPTVALVEVCGDTYQVASKNCPTRLKEVFVPGAEPKTVCPMHSGLITHRPGERKDAPLQKRPFHF